MYRPIRCTTLQEVRDQIDRVDTLIVGLIAERTGYVVQAARFKDTKEAVRIPTRIEFIIDRVRVLAQETGLDPAMIESVYRQLIEQSIERESRYWDEINHSSE
jgi:isochorismate pyruvate lyase